MPQCDRKQASLWEEGDLYRQNIHGQENGSSKAAVAGILSGVEDISINGSNKNVSPRKTASEPVSKSIYSGTSQFVCLICLAA